MKHKRILRYLTSAIIVSSIIISPLNIELSAYAQADSSIIDTWWPTDGSHMEGLQPFKALLENTDPSHYQMFWQVDGGQLNPMQDNSDGGAHKEVQVDLSGWTWRGKGPYAVTFVAQVNDATVSTKTVNIYNDAAPDAAPQPAAAPVPSTSAPAVVVSAPSVSVSASAPAVQQPPALPSPALPQVAIDVWWPTPSTVLTGSQPLKALVPSLPIDSYTMYWQVDGGQLNPMQDNPSGGAHKEADIAVSGWNWHGAGIYTINFLAKDQNGTVIAEQNVPVDLNNAGPVVLSAPAVSISGSDPLAEEKFYVDQESQAAQQAQTWATSDVSGAAAMQVLAQQPTAVWMGDWNSNVYNDVRSVLSQAAGEGSMPVLVAYDIPERDCGGYSSGGATSAGAYQGWINSFAQALDQSKAAVVLEPDALAGASCLSASDQEQRFSLLSQATSALKADKNAAVYIDAGHSGWVDPSTMAGELEKAGIQNADGFSLDVSNFDSTASEVAYGTQVSEALQKLTGQDKHFIIDTSRNGNGGNGQWCNPPGQAIGQRPTAQTGNSLVDAYLWIKTPGQSDGTCNGGPSAGTWWPQYAVELVQNAGL